MKKTFVVALLVAVGISGSLGLRAQQKKGAPSLEERIKALEAKVATVQDVQDIYNLQNAYGYYLDKKLWDDVSDLFTDDAVVEINARGVYKGANVRNLFKGAMGGGVNGLQFGTVNTHMQLQGVVHVDADGTAKGRWRSFAMLGGAGREGRPGMAMWSDGQYEITYKKVNGKWMFRTMRWDPAMNADFHQGWDKPVAPNPGPQVAQGSNTSRQFPPDEPPSRPIKPFPEIDILPFHYTNPVTGKPTVIPAERK